MTKINDNNWRNEYDTVESLSNHYGIYIVRKSDKMGVVKITKENTIDYAIPFEYDIIKILYKNNYLLLAQKQNKKRILKVTKTKTIISSDYDEIGPYVSGVELIPVANGDLVGAVDKELNEIIPVQFDKLDDSTFQIEGVGKWRHPAFHDVAVGKWGTDAALIMKKNGKLGMLNVSGKQMLPFEYDEIDEGFIYKIKGKSNVGWRKWQVEKEQEFTRVGYQVFLEGSQIYGSGIIPVKKDNAWGLIDAVYFKEITPFVYRSITQNTYDRIILFKGNGYDLLIPTKDGYRIESVIIDLEQYSEIGEFEDGLAIVQKNGKCGFVNEEYKEVVPCIYDEIGPFIHGLSIVRIGEMYGAINNEGKITIPLEYPLLIDLSIWCPTMLMAVKNNRFGVVDKANKIIVPFEFDLVQAMFGMIIVTKNGKKGLYNHKGELVIPIEYDDIAQPSAKSQTYALCIAGKWGVVNKKEEIIIPIEYVGVSHISSGCMYSVCKAGKWSIINKNGENITPFIYDKIDKDGFGFTCGRLSVCRDDKWGFINRNGREIIECIYDDVIQFFEENRSEVMFNGMKITIDIYGNQI